MKPSPIPGPPGWFPLEFLQALRDSPLVAFEHAVETYGDLVRIPLGPRALYLVRHPAHVELVLRGNRRNYRKDTFQYNLLSDIAGQGLLSSEGELWLRQRRLLQPAFHRSRVARMGEEMVRVTRAMLQRWEPAIARGEPIELEGEFLRLSMEIVGRTLFRSDLGGEGEALVRAVVTALDDVIHRAQHPLTLPEPFPTPRNRRFRAARRTLDEAVTTLIARQRRRGPGDDLLSMLLAAQAAGEGMSDEQLRDEVVTLIIAGHETVATALTWAAYLLATHPAAAARLREEVSAQLGDETPTVESIPRLPYTGALWNETLRLYPPTWVLSRRAVAAATLGEHILPAGALILLSPYLTHRHPRYWPDPNTFRPSRFLEPDDRPPFAYYPYGGGPHLCIGNRFATLEATLILALLAPYHLTLARPLPVKFDPLVTLRPKGGMRMIVAGRVQGEHGRPTFDSQHPLSKAVQPTG